MTCSPQVKVLPWSSSITSWSASPLFTNKRLSIRTPVSLTSRTLHGAEKPPRCRRPPRLTSTRAPLRLNPIGPASYFRHHSKRPHNSKGNCQMELQFLLTKGAHLFHALAIDAQIAV